MDGVLPNKLPAPGRRFAASVERAQGYLPIVHVKYPRDLPTSWDWGIWKSPTWHLLPQSCNRASSTFKGNRLRYIISNIIAKFSNWLSVPCMDALRNTARDCILPNIRKGFRHLRQFRAACASYNRGELHICTCSSLAIVTSVCRESQRRANEAGRLVSSAKLRVKTWYSRSIQVSCRGLVC